MHVTLTPWEYMAAINNAAARFAASKDKGIKDIHHETRSWFEELKIDVLGSCGEIVVAKSLNQFWSPSVNTMHKVADVGRHLEVRTSPREDASLIVRANDPEDRWYFLVTGEPPVLTIRGYISGAAARKDEWVRNPHGHRQAWFVPQSALTPIEERISA